MVPRNALLLIIISVLTSLLQAPPNAIGQPVNTKSRVEEGFFNGKNLAGWDADDIKFWSVKDGAIVGTAGDQKIPGNQFLWYKMPVTDFRLTLKVKQTPYAANAGIQFRSARLKKGAHGYQADVGEGWWGTLYHEHGRKILAQSVDAKERNIKREDWNHYEILAVGQRIWLAINGKVTVALRDKFGELEGRIAVQIHGGLPQTVTYKDLKLVHNPKIELVGMDEDALNALLIEAPETGATPNPIKKKKKKTAQAVKPQDKPNVIIVMTDDQGYGELSSHGHPYLKTPNLDRLAATGVELTDFHVSAKCSPTRGALMTGRHCRHVGVREADNGRNIIGRKFPVSAEIFSANAYATGIFGKWHLGGHAPFRPQDRGFQETLVHGNGAIGTTGDIWGNDYIDDTYWHNGKKKAFKGYCTDIWFNEAMAFMKRSREQGKPFFCYVPTNAPHGPYIVPNKYAEPYAKAAGRNANRIGMIASIDENMGRLMDFLESSGLEENTILIFLTDNGAPKTGSNGEMRGGKGNGYDGGHRVPFLVRWPKGGITGGRKDDTLTAHIDILPTMIDLCGIKADKATVFDGVSFKPLLTGGEKPKALNRTLIESYNGIVMTEKWRLVEGTELYDIQKDTAQKNNVAKDHPDLVKQFRDALAKNRTHDHKVTPRIIIGSEQQPHQEFTIYHWFDHHGYFTHSKVTTGELINGVIPVEVTVPGTFEFVLRRWPTELNVPIRSKPDKTVAGYQLFNRRNTPSQYKALDIQSAQLKVAQFDQTKPVTDKMASVTFTVDLDAGETDIETWFRTAANETLGAYYLSVTREDVTDTTPADRSAKKSPAGSPALPQWTPPDKEWVSLFNGKDLTGWQTPKGEHTWQVIEGVIDYEARGGNLVTKKTFNNYKLHIEWRIKRTEGDGWTALLVDGDGVPIKDKSGRPQRKTFANADSGIFLRGGGKSQLNLWCWPCGSGQMWWFKNHEDPEVRKGAWPDKNADKPVGQWNAFDIELIGEAVTVVLNGQTIAVTRMPGIGQAGRVALQHHGGYDEETKKWNSASALVQFRNIWIKELPAEQNVPAKQAQPNVVLIFSDDMGYSDLPKFGKSEIPTPSIDRLAKEGTLFTDAYVTAPICVASRMGLLTGQYQQRFGIYDNIYGEDKVRLFLDQTLLSAVFQDAGYRTAHVGKWHLGGNKAVRYKEGEPRDRGFDETVGIRGGHADFWKGTQVFRNGKQFPAPEYLTDLWGTEACAFIDRNQSNPFFLYLAYNAVHSPMHALEADRAKFPEVQDENRRIYDGMLLAMDRSIGRVLDRLDKHGIADNTIVVFLNDNGGGGSTNRYAGHSRNYANNKPLSGHKFDVLEGGVRVPMIIRCPGQFPADYVYGEMVSSTDVFPTLVAAAGLQLPKGQPTDGVDILPFINGKNASKPHEWLCWQNRSWLPRKKGGFVVPTPKIHNSAIRKGNWKLVRLNEKIGSEVPPPAWRLYDLEKDIGEKKDVAAQNLSVVKELDALFDKWRASMHPTVE